jgi:FlaA1/EpsC-like NDP-sugar epimerase
MLTDKVVVVTGGTGSLGNVLVRRLLAGELGQPRKMVVFSRDEAKQHAMRLHYLRRDTATEEIIYQESERRLKFQIGDIRDFHAVSALLRDADVVFNAAALKQVPTCEYFPYEAVQTNVTGAENIVRAIREHGLPVEAVIGISTDKACKPVNVMGMTKAIQERLFLRANLDCLQTRFVCARYGNVLASRGSVIPLFHHQINQGGPVTITTAEMTRFLLSLDHAVDTIFDALRDGRRGQTYIPRACSARVQEIAKVLISDRPIRMIFTGVRPGEKTHEILVSEEEGPRTYANGPNYVIDPILPELRVDRTSETSLNREFSSGENLLTIDQLRKFLTDHSLLEPNPSSATHEIWV